MNERELIMNQLKANGIDITYDELLDDLLASDSLSAQIANASEDQLPSAILGVLPEYIAMHTVGTSAASDPTKTVAAPTAAAMPTLTAAQNAANTQLIQQDAAKKQMVSEQGFMAAVLADRPGPFTYMANIGKLGVNGDVEKIIADMRAKYQPNTPVSTLLTKKDEKDATKFVSFIPTTAQLRELAEIHKANKKGTSKAVPAWYEADNDAKFNDIMGILTSDDKTFDVLVAPEKDTVIGDENVKAWKWNTKGFVLRIPAEAAGAADNTDKIVTKKGLTGFLIEGCAGYILPKGNCPLSCELKTITPKADKNASASAAAAQAKYVARVRGNNIAGNPEVRFINEVGAGKAKMTCRSQKYYYRVTPKADGKFTISKVRISLVWNDAPEFVRKAEFVKAFPVKATNGGVSAPDAQRAFEIQQAQIALAAQILSNPVEVGACGLGDFFTEVQNLANKNEADRAKELTM